MATLSLLKATNLNALGLKLNQAQLSLSSPCSIHLYPATGVVVTLIHGGSDGGCLTPDLVVGPLKSKGSENGACSEDRLLQHMLCQNS